MDKSELKKRLAAKKLGVTSKKVVTGIGQELSDAIDKLVQLNVTLQQYFVERDETISQLCFALATREHLLLKGKPGTAKSMLGKTVLEYIQGANVFSIQFSKFMSEDYVLGPINPKKLRDEGIIEHNLDGYITQADYAFIDEFFDGSDILLRSMLEILNERTFTRGSQQVECPMRSCVLTSNYIRDQEITDAVLDRIIFKNEVSKISDRANRVSMYTNFLTGNGNMGKDLKKIGMTMDDMDLIADAVQAQIVDIPTDVLTTFDEVVNEFAKQSGVFVSDRKANILLKIIKTVALLEKREIALQDDISDIYFGLVNVGDQQQADIFQSVFAKATAKSREQISQEGTLETLEVQMSTIENKHFDILGDTDLLQISKRLGSVIKDLKGFKGVTTEIENRRKLCLDKAEDAHSKVQGKLGLNG